MNMIASNTPAQELLTFREYGVEEMPNTLVPMIDGVIDLIVEAYKKAYPDQTFTQEQALEWFDSRIETWQHSKEVQTNQDAVLQTIRELTALGDVREIEGRLVILPKSAARMVVFTLAEMSKVADEKGRDFEQDELMAMEYVLTIALVTVRNYREKTP